MLLQSLSRVIDIELAQSLGSFVPLFNIYIKANKAAILIVCYLHNDKGPSTGQHALRDHL